MKPTTQPSRPHIDCLTLLRRHAIFGKLSVDHLKRLCALSTTRRVAAAGTIVARGDVGTALFGVSAGTVKIIALPLDGQSATTKLLHSGETFGEFALLDGQPQSIAAVAVTDCELMVIKRGDFQRLLHAEPKVALKLIEVLSAGLREATLLTVSTRLARAVASCRPRLIV